MIKEKSAGAIIFKKDDKIRYLFLKKKYKTEYWDLPKGNIEKGENEEETVKREIEEETGLKDLKFVKGFKEKINYFYKKEKDTVFKEVVFFLAESKSEEVKISPEHDSYEWVVYEEAINRVKDNTRKVFEKVHVVLEEGLNKFV
ncbi:MAG: NUDIX domain-containing protein [Candidatus Aenigmatarchaeota archaeon]